MSKYLCEECKYNNNGWCKIKQFNGLRKKNIQECEDFKGNAKYTHLEIIKSLDGEGRKSLTINVNNEAVFIPEEIITDFINDAAQGSIGVNIPGDVE